MLHGVKINGVDTYERYGLVLLADLVISAAKLKKNRVSVPGMDGTLNLSYTPQGAPTYEDRTVSFTLFKAVSDVELELLRSEIANLWHGQEVSVEFPLDENHYFYGEIWFGDISGYNTGRIPVGMTVSPWKLKKNVTTVSLDLTGEYQALTLPNERRRVVPTITVTEDTTLLWGEDTYAINAGTHRLLDIHLAQGENILQAKLTSAAAGTITVTYQEASL